MISELDIYRAANLVIKRHGGDAVIEAARMVDRMLERGDPEGRVLWQRIRRAIEVLQAATDGRLHFVRPPRTDHEAGFWSSGSVVDLLRVMGAENLTLTRASCPMANSRQS